MSENELIIENMKLEEKCIGLQNTIATKDALHKLEVAKLKERHTYELVRMQKAISISVDKAINPPVIYSDNAQKLAQEKIKEITNMSFWKRLKFLLKGEVE